MEKLLVVSSRWTFFFKLALPLFWGILGAGITILFYVSPLDSLKKPFDPWTARLLFTSFYLSSIVLLYLLFGNVKWVAIQKDHLIVSNFFHSYKYTLDSIAAFDEVNWIVFRKVTIKFHQKTFFGSEIHFVKSHYWTFWLQEKNK